MHPTAAKRSAATVWKDHVPDVDWMRVVAVGLAQRASQVTRVPSGTERDAGGERNHDGADR
jgi:hypothetical protein